MGWINIKDQAPQEKQLVWAFFDITGVCKMVYHDLEGTQDKDFGKHCFIGNGWLIDDVTHWMPYCDEKPDPPEHEAKHTAYEAKDIPWPDCSKGCFAMEYFGVGECEDMCPKKFKKDDDNV